jgi:2-polyprenyl-3-methyl-5-hydroxy-6-metoxy-1,4-benzoquinol methylase
MISAAPSEPRRSKAEKFWDRLARTWGKPTEESDQTDTKVLAKTRPYLKATDSVLDYGCAKGSVDLKLAAAVQAIHGIDISSKMIATAQEAAEAREVATVSFARATIFDESLERESFEVVLAFNIFHLLEDAPGALRRRRAQCWSEA